LSSSVAVTANDPPLRLAEPIEPIAGSQPRLLTFVVQYGVGGVA
jgi:hypothetical protein